MMSVRLGDIAQKVRSKNAGPFWLTIDIFCGEAENYKRIVATLSTAQVAALFDTAPQHIKRFEISDLNVIKFSLPRPSIQGSVDDRDIHGASWASLLSELSIE